jgi:hypothetical protein
MMGRREYHASDRGAVDSRLNLSRVRLSGDYDSGGAYWGSGGLPLYCVSGDFGDDAITFYLRATDRDHAKEQIHALGYINARFYR